MAESEILNVDSGAEGPEGITLRVAIHAIARGVCDSDSTGATEHLARVLALESKRDRPWSRADENLMVRKVVGARVRRARELCGLAQDEAASALGDANSTQLSLIENGERMPSLPRLISLARCFGTSVDFLLGLTADPDEGPASATRRALMRRIEDSLNANAARIADAVLASTRQDLPVRAASLARLAQRLVDAVNRLADLNPDSFQDLRGGSTAMHAATLLHEAIADARGALSAFEQATRSTACVHSLSPTTTHH